MPIRTADDYIASFAREVNRGRVLHVEAVMTPLNGAAPRPGPTVAAGATLESAARLLIQGNEAEAAVIDALGKPVGRITLQQVARAMVTPRTADNAAEPMRSPSEVAALASAPCHSRESGNPASAGGLPVAGSPLSRG